MWVCVRLCVRLLWRQLLIVPYLIWDPVLSHTGLALLVLEKNGNSTYVRCQSTAHVKKRKKKEKKIWSRYCPLRFSVGYFATNLKHFTSSSHPPLVQFNNSACGCNPFQLFVILIFFLPPAFTASVHALITLFPTFFFRDQLSSLCVYFPHTELWIYP